MTPATATLRRLRLDITGAVQGVGFRPHVYRLATEAGLAGWVVNDLEGVRIEVEGESDELESFRRRLKAELPVRAVVRRIRHEWLEPAGFTDFRIRRSDGGGAPGVTVLPDLATCPACLAEVMDPEDRRYGYAFTNCTDCGPRLSIVRGLPYDRPLTTMAGFAMCPACAAEYDDPLDRRFHAQPNACPQCGPKLEWRQGPDGPDSAATPDPLQSAAAAILAGRIVAVKGLGGFHLVCDATDADAVARLRERKGRPTKPLAVMVRGLDEARRLCRVSETAAELLAGHRAPIVLLPRRSDTPIAPGVAPGNPHLGLFLPYTPLHHRLVRAVGGPVVATSGNRSEEPICTDNDEAIGRLGEIADDFLLHDRPIERPVDDSVVLELGGRCVPLRRSRGFAPFPVELGLEAPEILAVGGQQKNVVGLARGGEAWLGPHIGELGAAESREAFDRSVHDLLRLYRVRPEIIAHDLHPDYVSTARALAWAAEWRDPEPRAVGVQHHHAHLASVLAEHGRTADPEAVLGVIWDGTGYGTDGTIWGGEFLLGTAAGFERVAHLRTFRLPGGEAAIREPGRIALALLHEAGLFPEHCGLPADRIDLLLQLLDREVAAPVTSSAGRLFDGVAALLGLVRTVSFEGEAAMALEYAADRSAEGAYALVLRPAPDGGPTVVDWEPAVSALLGDLEAGVPVGTIAGRFHNGLVEVVEQVADRIDRPAVALSGGCFQNRILAEDTDRSLDERGFEVLRHSVVPPNDGGLALGQIAVAAATRQLTDEGR